MEKMDVRCVKYMLTRRGINKLRRLRMIGGRGGGGWWYFRSMRGKVFLFYFIFFRPTHRSLVLYVRTITYLLCNTASLTITCLKFSVKRPIAFAFKLLHALAYLCP
jgi:hypothetical protein